MKTDDFDYYLPEELIAQTPLEKRDSSKLLVLDKNTGEIIHEKFSNIINYLNKGDVLVLNDTKVMPARIIGTKKDTGAVIELLMLKEISKDEWEVLSKPAKRVKIGTIIKFSDKLEACCTGIKEVILTKGNNSVFNYTSSGAQYTPWYESRTNELVTYLIHDVFFL